VKSQHAAVTLVALKKIYSRKIIPLPRQLQVDPGSEFKGVFKDYLKEKGVFLRVGKVNRHRQQGLVERRNQQIAVTLFKRQCAQEILTGIG
jgi:hypothetical protein